MSEDKNIGDQSTDNSSQPIENSNENISEPSTINDQPSTEKMEVHKHPHLQTSVYFTVET